MNRNTGSHSASTLAHRPSHKLHALKAKCEKAKGVAAALPLTGRSAPEEDARSPQPFLPLHVPLLHARWCQAAWQASGARCGAAAGR